MLLYLDWDSGCSGMVAGACDSGASFSVPLGDFPVVTLDCLTPQNLAEYTIGIYAPYLDGSGLRGAMAIIQRSAANDIYNLNAEWKVHFGTEGETPKPAPRCPRVSRLPDTSVANARGAGAVCPLSLLPVRY